MRQALAAILALLFLLGACSNDTTGPPPSNENGIVRGEIGDSDFEFRINGGDPNTGPFSLRGSNIHYDDVAGALVVDLTVKNLGGSSHAEPIGLTFISLDPDDVTLLNPDNGEHGDGAAIVFAFANDDGQWSPDETSLPRTVQFGVAEGQSIAFVARLDLGDPVEKGGTIAGRVWNDTDRDGKMDDGEPGIPGVFIHMSPFSDDSTGTHPFWRAQTDEDGRYAFHDLSAGGYRLVNGPMIAICEPTTPTEIHVILVEVNGEVSSYRNANFGVALVGSPPPWLGQRVLVTGKFYEPETFVMFSIERVVCPVNPGDAGPEPDPRCVGGTLRGPVTAIASDAFKIMNTWVAAGLRIPFEIQVGMRLDVHVYRAGNVGSWIADSIKQSVTPRPDELHGVVEDVDAGPDGVVRIRVLDTWIILANTTDPGL